MDNLGSIRPLHVVVICLVVMTVGGGSLLLSASEAPILVDGAVAWSEGSVLHAVVGLLCLNYEVATNHAGDVKNYILCLGAGLAILALSIAVVVRAPTEVPGSANGDDEASASANGNGGRAKRKAHVGPLFAAQLLVGLYLLWSFASSRWSSAPDLALGGSLLLGMYFLWSFALGHALGLEAARIASRLVLAIAVVTSLVAIWYYYGRNPNLRAKFPYGNPTFLAASLIPGMLLAISLICEKTLRAVRTRRVGPLGMAIVGLGAAVACLLACYLSGSRGAAVGLVFGVLGMAFFAVRGHARWIPAGLAIVVSLSGWVYYTGLAGSNEPAARSATIRTREFAWDYALRLFAQHPLRGYGQGGFVLAGDSFAPNDVLADPPALKTRLAHVHNEWLEVMADLGSIGITLIVVALALTLAAGGAALRILPSENLRWPLIGLLGALIGLVVEEMFGVGLRTAGVATAFYTVIGLIWAFSVRRTSRVGFVLATPGRRWMAGGVGCVVGLACLAIAHRDFMAARDSFGVGESFYTDDFDRTIRLAERATQRLNPQRALANIFRLSEAHLRAAEFFQAQASDREHRAYLTEPANNRLLALAAGDFQLSGEHCDKGSKWLKELVKRSPGFINHGHLAYRFSLTRAQNPPARENAETRKALLHQAAVGVRRELHRQPFDAVLAANYVGISLPLADPQADLSDYLDILARPLRYGRITRPYAELLSELSRNRVFMAQFDKLVGEAARGLAKLDDNVKTAEWSTTWVPEKLRLAAAVRFFGGDYRGASALLEGVEPACRQLAETAPLGAAGCLAELADTRFYYAPTDPSRALAAAASAIAMAPDSLEGGKLEFDIRARMVDYLLAAGREEEADGLLRSIEPRGTADQARASRLGVRYRRLVESLFAPSRPGAMLAKPPDALMAHARRWAGRAVELVPNDPQAHFVAANVDWHVGDEESLVEHLREGLRLGLPPTLVASFLSIALEERPESAAMQALLDSVTKDATPTDGQGKLMPGDLPVGPDPLTNPPGDQTVDPG